MAQFSPGGMAAGAAVSAGFLAWAVRGRASQVFGPSVWRGPRDRPAIYLTLDDGPSESTAQVLEILSRHAIPATFFQCGVNVHRLPGAAREVLSAGHAIGNHSHTHPAFYLRSARFIEDELTRAQDAIEQHTGTRPTWFRSPYGTRWFGLRRAQRRLSLTGVMWTVIGYDWKLTAKAVVERIARGVSNGAILCLHDGRELLPKPDIGVTLEALRRVIPVLLDRGYHFEPLSRLLCPTKLSSGF
jgi:peptidoglycan-N-acetylglucosamine deacetylase